MKIPRGSLLLEALIAIGVGALFTSALASYVLLTNVSTERATENTTAVWNAQTGLDAMQTIAFDDLPFTDTGAVTFADNEWSVNTSGPQLLENGSSRLLMIQTVNRDAQCFVTATGGTVDTDSKKLTSQVTWTDAANRNHTHTLTSLRTNWENPVGSCFAPTQAAQVTFDVSRAEFSGGKQLRFVYFTNHGTDSVTVDKISLTWTSAAQFDQLFMDTSKVWSVSGPGTPTHALVSGETADIQDFSLGAGGVAEINKGQFNIQMTGVTLTMTVTFADGSVWISPAFNPI